MGNEEEKTTTIADFIRDENSIRNDNNEAKRYKARMRYATMPKDKKEKLLAARREAYTQKVCKKKKSALEAEIAHSHNSNINNGEQITIAETSSHAKYESQISYEKEILFSVQNNLDKSKIEMLDNRTVAFGAEACEPHIATTILPCIHENQPLNSNRFARTFTLVTIPWQLKSVPMCSFCNAIRFPREPPSFCCSQGEISLAPHATPEVLYNLFTNDQSTLTLEFRKRARSYNNAFAFTSLGMKTDKNSTWANKGIYALKVVGQVFHHLPDPNFVGNNFHHLQLYFYEVTTDIDDQLLKSANFNPTIVQVILDILRENPYAKFFRNLRSYNNLENYKIVIHRDPSLDQRVYNLPIVSQIAAIWIESENVNDNIERDIRVYANGGGSHKINYYYGCYDPLQYPLLFPSGEPGWHTGIERIIRHIDGSKRNAFYCKGQNLVHAQSCTSAEDVIMQESEVLSKNKKRRTTISCREYYCYRLQMRSNATSCLLHSGRLGHQYAIDMYIKLETSRLDYYRSEQQQNGARTESYQGIVDCLSVFGENDTSKVGRRIILPASFIGGPRDMRKRYINAMTLVQEFGKPDLFLTMTCNPQWAEIKRYLLRNEKADDRPDLIARVFHAKLQELKDEIIRKKLFGPVAAYVYVIEYQKRGLPHVHWILIFKSDYKITSSDIYDNIISAELPRESDHPFLHTYVTQHMMHGPCGDDNPGNICMQKGQCKNHYPKKFCTTTLHGQSSYPEYRRRNDGSKVMVRKCLLDNRWVVPYNPYLLAKFNCHINVEICSDIKLVKYLYKYVYKGHDRVTFQIISDTSASTYDEIEEYQNGRWISAPEAYWRIYGFPMTEMYPSVIVLHVHLPNQQYVSFGPQTTIEQILCNPMLGKTMLTEFFWMNSYDDVAKGLNLLYVEFPRYFVWLASHKRWKRRQRKNVVARLAAVGIAEGERYYERLLLMHVRAPTSYSNLKMVNAIQYHTFREAALQRGLLTSDNYIDECIIEASRYQMPHSLRKLFATILVYCLPADPSTLWNRFFSILSEDIASSGSCTEHEIKYKTMVLIDKELSSMGKNISDYSFSGPYRSLLIQDDFNREYEYELSICVTEEDLLSIKKLNTAQKQAFDSVIHSIEANKGIVYFLDGPGGTGKTYLYRAILAYIRSHGNIALAVATSGIAAALLPGGRTAHSRFKLPLEMGDNMQCNIVKQSGLAKLIIRSKIIIWDEASMAAKYCIEALDKTLQDITSSTLIFGGKVILLGGDFRQTLPIVVRGSKQDFISASLISSYIWPKVLILHLFENMRAQNDPSFVSFLLRIGNGIEPQGLKECVEIPDSMTIPFSNISDSIDGLISFVFPSFNMFFVDPYSVVNRAILTPKNECVDELNTLLIERFPGIMKEYIGFDTTTDPKQQAEYEDFLNAMDMSSLPPYRLRLKPGSPIILLRNLNPADGLCNGTRMICKDLGQNLIGAEIAFGQFKGKHVFIPRISLESSDKLKCPIPFKRNQFPVRLCFATTINKAQGQTLDRVGVYLPEPVFSHGQLYVALSRARSSDSVKVLIKPILDEDAIKNYTKNIVYQEVLQACQLE